jgi:hypothetical protein
MCDMRIDMSRVRQPADRRRALKSSRLIRRHFFSTLLADSGCSDNAMRLAVALVSPESPDMPRD